jgi:HSP20 family protein
MPISDLLPWNRDKEKYALQKRDEFDPFDLSRQMDAMMQDFFNQPFGMEPLRRALENESGFVPRMDISESEKEIQISADLPGLDEKDIHLTVENHHLTISGEKQSEVNEKDRTYHRVERRYGAFSRTIELPTDVEIEKIDASFKKGVLKVSIPKPAGSVSERKRIPIKAG